MSGHGTHRRFNDVRSYVGSWGQSGNVANVAKKVRSDVAGLAQITIQLDLGRAELLAVSMRTSRRVTIPRPGSN